MVPEAIRVGELAGERLCLWDKSRVHRLPSWRDEQEGLLGRQRRGTRRSKRKARETEERVAKREGGCWRLLRG